MDQKPKTIPTLKEFAGYQGGKGGIYYVTEYLYLRVLQRLNEWLYGMEAEECLVHRNTIEALAIIMTGRQKEYYGYGRKERERQPLGIL